MANIAATFELTILDVALEVVSVSEVEASTDNVILKHESVKEGPVRVILFRLSSLDVANLRAHKAFSLLIDIHLAGGRYIENTGRQQEKSSFHYDGVAVTVQWKLERQSL